MWTDSFPSPNTSRPGKQVLKMKYKGLPTCEEKGIGRWWTNNFPSIPCQEVWFHLRWTGFGCWWPNFAGIEKVVPGLWKRAAGRAEDFGTEDKLSKTSPQWAQSKTANFPSWILIPDILFQIILDYLATVKLITFVSVQQQSFLYRTCPQSTQQHTYPRPLNRSEAMLRKPWWPPRDWQESSSVKLFGAQKLCVMKTTCDIQVKCLEKSDQKTHSSTSSVPLWEIIRKSRAVIFHCYTFLDYVQLDLLDPVEGPVHLLRW